MKIRIALAVMMTVAPVVFAQDAATTASNSAQMQRLMAARYAAHGGQMGMNPLFDKDKIQKAVQTLIEMIMVAKMVEKASVFQTDNGFVVFYGNTLKKYDKDLNEIKEVNLDVDIDGMDQVATKIAQKYAGRILELFPMPGAAGPSMGGGLTSPSAGVSSAPKGYDPQHEAEIKKEIEQMK